MLQRIKAIRLVVAMEAIRVLLVALVDLCSALRQIPIIADKSDDVLDKTTIAKLVGGRRRLRQRLVRFARSLRTGAQQLRTRLAPGRSADWRRTEIRPNVLLDRSSRTNGGLHQSNGRGQTVLVMRPLPGRDGRGCGKAPWRRQIVPHVVVPNIEGRTRQGRQQRAESRRHCGGGRLEWRRPTPTTCPTDTSRPALRERHGATRAPSAVTTTCSGTGCWRWPTERRLSDGRSRRHGTWSRSRRSRRPSARQTSTRRRGAGLLECHAVGELLGLPVLLAVGLKKTPLGGHWLAGTAGSAGRHRVVHSLVRLSRSTGDCLGDRQGRRCQTPPVKLNVVKMGRCADVHDTARPDLLGLMHLLSGRLVTAEDSRC